MINYGWTRSTYRSRSVLITCPQCDQLCQLVQAELGREITCGKCETAFVADWASPALAKDADRDTAASKSRPEDHLRRPGEAQAGEPS